MVVRKKEFRGKLFYSSSSADGIIEARRLKKYYLETAHKKEVKIVKSNRKALYSTKQQYDIWYR